jgi:hypothetical protein
VINPVISSINPQNSQTLERAMPLLNLISLPRPLQVNKRGVSQQGLQEVTPRHLPVKPRKRVM